jgi:hypothetical protein
MDEADVRELLGYLERIATALETIAERTWLIELPEKGLAREAKPA